VGVVARCVALRITAALGIMSVSSRSNGSNNNISGSNNKNVGRLRVQTGFDERHLLEDKSERIRRWGERALLRDEGSGMSKAERRRVGGTRFWCHGGRRRKKHNDRQR
jgi:hypothetical protein